jgi:hypothetical protein|eukprot:COSAG01_NODE_7527_length_3165_cov_203.129159_2_plen_79_part_00
MELMQVVLLGTVITGAEAYHYDLGNIIGTLGNYSYELGNRSYDLGNTTTGLCKGNTDPTENVECPAGFVVRQNKGKCA